MRGAIRRGRSPARALLGPRRPVRRLIGGLVGRNLFGLLRQVVLIELALTALSQLRADYGCTHEQDSDRG